MKPKKLIERISSELILQKILNYIEDENTKLKLFFKIKFKGKNIFKLTDYKEKYIKKLGIDINEYLSCYISTDVFNKNFLENKFKNDLIKYKLDENVIKEVVVNYFEKYSKSLKEDIDRDKNIFEKSEIPIDIYSPFFDILSKEKYFEEIFNIQIPITIIKNEKLINDYISIFRKFNNSNIKYSSLKIISFDADDMDYLKKFEINFNQIKRLTINQTNINLMDYKKFFEPFFSFDNIEKNLVYLNINLLLIKTKIDSNLIENLNNFKSLKFLIMKRFKFEKIFTLKLNNLKELILKNCENITFEENSCLNIKKLILYDCLIIKPKSLIKFPELEICELERFNYIDQKYDLIIDFSNLKNLKYFTGEICDFINLEDPQSLLNVKLTEKINISKEIEKEMIEKFCSIKSLKNINFQIFKINNNDISKIQGKNPSIINVEVNWMNQSDECILSNFLKKFPSIENLVLETPYIKYYKTFLFLEEEPNCKIDNFSIKGGGNNAIKFYISPYEKLVSIFFDFYSEIFNLENCFPLLNEKCTKIFSSLKCFKLSIFSEYKNILNNLYNNLDKMPNLQDISINYNTTEFSNKAFYQKFIKKLLSLKLNSIYFSIKEKQLDFLKQKDEIYSEKELKEICPEINCTNLKNIIIFKLKNFNYI